MKIINIKFEGIDDWHRPVFKSERNIRYGDVNCTKTGKPDEVKEFYRKNIHLLEYFGKTFGCEPHGRLNENVALNIID